MISFKLKTIVLAMCILKLFSACEQQSENNLILENGVSEKLAKYRSKQLSEVHYDLAFNIPNELAEPINSTLNLDVTILDLNKPLILDFNPDKVNNIYISVNGQTIKTINENEHISIPSKGLKLGQNKVIIEFVAGELSLNRSEDYLYTLLVPDRARTLFPCFDQPNIKATYTLNISTPKNWKVLSGASLKTKTEINDRVEFQFGKTDLMSTYLFSFVAGIFATVKNDGMQMLYRETDSAKISSSIIPIFDLHQSSIQFLENYTSKPFPFQKMDFAAIPGFQYGGMEHTGAIQYRESKIFLDNSATKSHELSRAKLIAHETAHMWFGNLVTMKWFNDVWLKEVFANLMADKIINPSFPTINHNLQFITGHYPSAYDVDRTKGTNPIRQNLDNLKNAGSLYGSIIYHKAPIMMRQLESVLGADQFQLGIAEYINSFANSNADWNELIDILDTYTDLDLRRWSKAWVNSPGRPIISSELITEKDLIQSFKITQNAEDGSEIIWPQLFEVSLIYPDTNIILPINLKDKSIKVTAAQGMTNPNYIVYNSNGFGYGIFPIDKLSKKEIPFIKDEASRGYSYINLFEKTLNADIKTDDALDILMTGLTIEENELILKNITSSIEKLFWTYLSQEDRITFQAKTESILNKRLLENNQANIKKTLFGLFQSIAFSESGKEMLYSIWNKDLVIDNLNLNEDNYTKLAMVLAIYEHRLTNEILEKAKSKISNPDKLKRFEFLLPSLSNNSNTRSIFFASLSDVSNRAKENWVLTACHYIHHPLRQETGIKQLEFSLNLLDEIQRTGDIFFPKAWLDNTIGMYSSEEAYDILEKFNLENKNLNPQLKMKFLQASDNLYRVNNIIN